MAQNVRIIDFSVTTTRIVNDGYIEVDFIPHYANLVEFSYSSNNPAIAIVDHSTGLVVALQSGTCSFTITEQYTGISKTVSIDIVLIVSVDFSQYLVAGYRPKRYQNLVNSTYNPTVDGGQTYTPANSYEIPAGYSSIIVKPFAWWVSSTRDNDTMGVIFADENNVILASYGYTDLWEDWRSSRWCTPAANVELAIPAGAKYLYISTSLTTDAAYIAPVIELA